MPASYPDLGPADVAPAVNGAVDPATLELTPEDFFVLTRIDGKTPLRDVVMICGLPENKTVAALVKLRKLGAIYLPGEKPARPSGSRARAVDAAALHEELDLTHEQRLAILEKEAQLRGASPHRILEVAPDADRRAVKLAYFRLSKEFHPDRFFGKRLGSFEKRLADIFETLARAFEILNEETTPGPVAVGDDEPTAPLSAAARARAAELFEEGCQAQVMGDTRSALARFEEALQMSPEGKHVPRYLRRAAEAALAVAKLSSAEEYAKKAVGLDPHHAGAHRILAKVFRAHGRTGEARRELEEASRLDPANQHIARELEELSRPR